MRNVRAQWRHYRLEMSNLGRSSSNPWNRLLAADSWRPLLDSTVLVAILPAGIAVLTGWLTG
jgi:hypothetical protein